MSNVINANIGNFIKEIDSLRNLVRYQTAPRVSSETVAEHSYFVAAYVLKLHDYLQFDLCKALKLALLHDFSESFISDVPHPIKKRFPLLNEALDKAENDIVKEYFSEEFSVWLKEFNECASAEGITVALADVLSVVSYAKYEMELGNSKYMKNVLIRGIARIYSILEKCEPYLKDGISLLTLQNHIHCFIDDRTNE